jgi:hypothetical protein
MNAGQIPQRRQKIQSALSLLTNHCDGLQVKTFPAWVELSPIFLRRSEVLQRNDVNFSR